MMQIAASQADLQMAKMKRPASPIEQNIEQVSSALDMRLENLCHSHNQSSSESKHDLLQAIAYLTACSQATKVRVAFVHKSLSKLYFLTLSQDFKAEVSTNVLLATA